MHVDSPLNHLTVPHVVGRVCAAQMFRGNGLAFRNGHWENRHMVWGA